MVDQPDNSDVPKQGAEHGGVFGIRTMDGKDKEKPEFSRLYIYPGKTPTEYESKFAARCHRLIRLYARTLSNKPEKDELINQVLGTASAVSVNSRCVESGAPFLDETEKEFLLVYAPRSYIRSLWVKAFFLIVAMILAMLVTIYVLPCINKGFVAYGYILVGAMLGAIVNDLRISRIKARTPEEFEWLLERVRHPFHELGIIVVIGLLVGALILSGFMDIRFMADPTIPDSGISSIRMAETPLGSLLVGVFIGMKPVELVEKYFVVKNIES